MSTSTVNAPALEIPLDLYPGISQFALELARGDESAARFCRPFSFERLPAASGQRRSSALVDALAASNRAWGNDVAPELEQWRRGDTVTLIAGQQVGAGGGPLYTFAKIASLLKLRRQLAERDVPATLFFWLATEDHDFREVATIALPAAGGIETITATSAPRGRPAVGALPLPDDLRGALAARFGDRSWLREGITFRDSFAELLAEAFRGEGIIMVDALLPALRSEGVGVLSVIADQHDALQRALSDRATELSAAGYRAQVAPSADGSWSLLFWLSEAGERESVRRDGAGWRIGHRRHSSAELGAMMKAEPWRVSTAALARPLLQDDVLQPDIFVGGPAEVAYYAQVAPLAKILGIAAPAVALRGHAIVAPARVLRIVAKENIAVAELFDSPDAMAARRSGGLLDRAIESASHAEAELVRNLAEFRALVARADGNVDRGIETSLRKIRYQFARIRRRGVRAIARRDEERYSAIRHLSDTIAPGGVPQDRVVAWLPFWAEHGRVLVERMSDAIEPHSDRVCVIGL